MSATVQALPRRDAEISITRFDNGVCEMNYRARDNAAALKALYSAIAYLQKEEDRAARNSEIDYEEVAA